MDVPTELLSLVFAHLLKPQHLASCCLVSKTFNTFAIPYLYRQICIFSWHKQGKTKVILLFNTLSSSPDLAKYVRHLEIRDFPKSSISFPEGDSRFLESVCRGIENCVNLRACTWTRDGALRTAIIDSLQRCNSLRSLTINGNSIGNYDPLPLTGIANLRKLSIIMPSRGLFDVLPRWLAANAETLRSLTIICKATPLLTDEYLSNVAFSLCNLEALHLTGCPKITQVGIIHILSANHVGGLVDLALESLSPRFDMEIFRLRCTSAGALQRLRSITLTIHQQTSLEHWMPSVANLLADSPLEMFHIYSTGAVFESPSTDQFWDNIVSAHYTRLQRFSVHRMLISFEAIRNICRRCARLAELFVVVEPDSLDKLAPALSQARNLRALHINYPLEAHSDEPPVLSPEKAFEVVKTYPTSLTQFGCNTRVWQVDRTVVCDDGDLIVERRLSRYENPNIPEQFLVQRSI